jgi:hypothetical protein
MDMKQAKQAKQAVKTGVTPTVSASFAPKHQFRVTEKRNDLFHCANRKLTTLQ